MCAFFSDKRTGRNIKHAIPTLLRQSINSRLAGYEDVNDAERLSLDPVMRAITGKKDSCRQAANANTMGRFETIFTHTQDFLQFSNSHVFDMENIGLIPIPAFGHFALYGSLLRSVSPGEQEPGA
ncbi:MAG: transposase [Candidatus Latescibacteria bacterium]|nr:transposase [Candidatus Latescibacterota bacterium]